MFTTLSKSAPILTFCTTLGVPFKYLHLHVKLLVVILLLGGLSTGHHRFLALFQLRVVQHFLHVRRARFVPEE